MTQRPLRTLRGWLSRRPFVVLALLLLLAVGLRGDLAGRALGCPPLRVSSITPDARFTGLFRDYGNDNSDHDDWSGGDGTWSVRLPDGRTLWISADTLLGRVNPPDALHRTHWRPPGGHGSSTRIIRNSAILQRPADEGGQLIRTVRGSTYEGTPRSWIDEPGAKLRYEPGAAIVEDGRLHVLAFVKDDSRTPEFNQGAIIRGVVIIFDPGDLSVPRKVTPLPVPEHKTLHDQVFYGFDAIVSGGHTYVFGGTDNNPIGVSAYVARVPVGSLDDPRAWRHWDGRGWERSADAARPIVPWRSGHTGTRHGYTVVKSGRTWVMFTMDPSRPPESLATYWSCGPGGPWNGPSRVYVPPEMRGGGSTGTIMAYNPHVHRTWSDERRGLLLSYDVNDVHPTEGLRNINDDVDRYRPRFVRVKFK